MVTGHSAVIINRRLQKALDEGDVASCLSSDFVIFGHVNRSWLRVTYLLVLRCGTRKAATRSAAVAALEPVKV